MLQAQTVKTLAKNIPDIHKKVKPAFHFERICNANSDLLSVLTTNKAVGFILCYVFFI